jgi:hypothetical protein
VVKRWRRTEMGEATACHDSMANANFAPHAWPSRFPAAADRRR